MRRYARTLVAFALRHQCGGGDHGLGFGGCAAGADRAAAGQCTVAGGPGAGRGAARSGARHAFRSRFLLRGIEQRGAATAAGAASVRRRESRRSAAGAALPRQLPGAGRRGRPPLPLAGRPRPARSSPSTRVGAARSPRSSGTCSAARRVSVVVPGSDNDAGTFDRKVAAHGAPPGMARTLHTAAGPDTAVVAWVGYTTPVGVGIDAATGSLAEAGAGRLTRFTEGLTADGLPEPAVFCHSYGSVVCGLAARRLPATDLVALGSRHAGGRRGGAADEGAGVGGEGPDRLDRQRAERALRGPRPRHGPDRPGVRRPPRTGGRGPGPCRLLRAGDGFAAGLRRDRAGHGHAGRGQGRRRTRRRRRARTPWCTRRSWKGSCDERRTENARRLAARIDASTPAHRDRAVDGMRALALLAVPLGHWMLGGFRLDSDGLHNASPLATFEGAGPRELGAPDAGDLLPGRRVRLGPLLPPPGLDDGRLAGRPAGPARPAGARGERRVGGAARGALRAGRTGRHAAYGVDAGDPAALVRRGVRRGHGPHPGLRHAGAEARRLGGAPAARLRRRRGLPALRAVRGGDAVLAERAQRPARLAVRVSARCVVGRGADPEARGPGCC